MEQPIYVFACTECEAPLPRDQRHSILCFDCMDADIQLAEYIRDQEAGEV